MKDLLHRTLSALALAVLLIPSCNENTVDPVFYGSIEGIVTYESSSAGVENAEITTSPASGTAISDEQGHFLLTNVPIGEYSVVAKLENYKNASANIVVTKDNTTFVQLTLLPDAIAPNPPQLIAPASGAESVARSVTLTWTVDELNDDGLKFDVVVYESNQSIPLTRVEDVPDTTLLVENLKFNTTYFWQVNASNTSGITTYGQLWHFTTLPFPDNRFLFASTRDGNYEIYSSDETGENLVRLTNEDSEQVYPQYTSDRRAIAFASYTELAWHIYVSNKDGSAPTKVTTLPLAGNHNDGRAFCWSPDNAKLLYSHFDKLYTVNRNGSGLTLVATAPAGRNFRACDWTVVGNRIIVETVGIAAYESEFRLIDLSSGTDDVIMADEPGILESPSFSVDGKYVLFTKDVSGYESETGRQLDAHIILHELATGTRTDLSVGKDGGTNDLHPRFSPDGARIIFENRKNDGSGTPAVFTYDITTKRRTLLFENASMPDWQ